MILGSACLDPSGFGKSHSITFHRSPSTEPAHSWLKKLKPRFHLLPSPRSRPRIRSSSTSPQPLPRRRRLVLRCRGTHPRRLVPPLYMCLLLPPPPVTLDRGRGLGHGQQLHEPLLVGGGVAHHNLHDKLLLDSLYEDAVRRQQAATDAYGNGHASSHQIDPFAMSNAVASPISVQMSAMAQQQGMLGMPQQFQPQYGAASQLNHFGDAYSALSAQGAHPLHGSSSLI